MSKQVIVVTGASSGFGAMSARALAKAGHTVYAGIRATTTRNAKAVADAAAFAKENNADLRSVELDVTDDASIAQAVESIVAENGRLDVIVHNAGHMSFGPAEAFTPEQYAELFDINHQLTQTRRLIPPASRSGSGADGA